MYTDLREVYWWNWMNKDIAEFVANYPNCQQVKVEHQKSGGLSQDISLPTWKWKVLNMVFIVGFPHTRPQYDSIWVIVHRMKKLVYFIPVKVSYSAKHYARLYLREMVRLHGVPFSIIYDRGPISILKRVSEVAFELDLSNDLATLHPLLHVSVLKKCVRDLTSIDPLKGLGVDESLSYEEVPIKIPKRQVKKLRKKEVASVKLLWRNHLVEGATWEAEAYMKYQYPHLFPSTLA
ncbi:hypothetical protein MTR67_011934 [Solanum verrucosum]|uniref:Uncharacterized protein n=1 Tax=Solanum verrucosum TaxID=315347 RepID=A0AAF0TH20_SOLVR|nr:hypothetical protein MTR67_011934 [Solanum verrucosum]